jgi:hypothetical protein
LIILSLFELAILHPIDVVKVRYQVYDKSGKAYTSLLSAFSTIVRNEGFQGLLKVIIKQI